MAQLHGRLTLEEAIAEFGRKEDAAFYCDGQFVVLPSVILCAFTVDETHLQSPSVVVWRPERAVHDPTDRFAWLPRAIRNEPGSPEQRTHHVLLRRSPGAKFLYAGEAHLGSYGGADPVAMFSLVQKLPRTEWLALGGYYGWQIEINHRKHHLEERDVRRFDQVVRGLEGIEFSHLEMTRYEEDSLTVFINASRGWLMYLRTPEDGGLYVDRGGAAEGAGTRELFRCFCGVSLDFEERNTLDRDAALAAAREFFITGELPRRYRWAEQ